MVVLSSTTSIRLLLTSIPTSVNSSFFSACFLKTAVNQNVDPFPSSLSTPILPPIISANRLDIANPRPVPPYLREVEVSTWEKDLKSLFIRSSGIPIPVSDISNLRVTSSSLSFSIVTRITTSPSFVNFTAFPARFIIT